MPATPVAIAPGTSRRTRLVGSAFHPPSCLSSGSECVEGGEPRLYMDPVLERDQKAYVRLINALHSRGRTRWTTTPKGFVGVFFVWKKNNKLRLICDARRANARFREPPG
eukprot:13529969-Heterocapsa_arctica.AAC.1